MNSTSIVGLGTAVAPFRAKQLELGEHYEAYLDAAFGDARIGRRARMIFRTSRIDTRQFVLPDFSGDEALLYRETVPSTAARMRVFADHAPLLAEQACRRAFASAGIRPDQVSHLVIATCTGVGAPDLDIELIERLGLPATTERTQIVWMSCAAGFPALRSAARAVSEKPDTYALVVCVELCSLHVRPDLDLGSLVAHSLFADGAAAVLVGSGIPEEDALLSLGAHRSQVSLAGRAALTWNLTDAGFQVRIDRRLPETIGDCIVDFVAPLFRAAPEIRSWCVHPGGAQILDRVELALGLARDALDASREVLRTLGNLSSSTLFYVLERELLRLRRGDSGLLLGFGTGLTLEGLLFRRGGRHPQS